MGGPWKHGGNAWERWRDGQYAMHAYANDDRPPYRVREGRVEVELQAGEWERVDKAEGYELHAPKDWIPTPDTIPEGCEIKTPEGVERTCGTCSFHAGNNYCPGGYGLECCPDEPYEYLKWCPSPSKPKQEWTPKVGDWVWSLGAERNPETRMAVQLERRDDKTCWYRCPVRGSEVGLPQHFLAPISIGDKVRVVEKPSHWCTLARAGQKARIAQEPSNDCDFWHVHVGGCAIAAMQDIRLIERVGT